MTGWIMAFIFIVVCTAMDMKEKNIGIEWLVMFFVLGIVYSMYVEREGRQIIFSMIPGIIVLILAIITREKIGKGDGVMIVNLGILLGFKNIINVLMVSLIVCAVASLLMIVIKRVNKNYEIPFAPFLMVALALIGMCGGI
ncbi:MAG: hypothetical protein E7254_01540 [Lachnospiraceae bacterium]|nr:hypothetical protein [Lachnospiraceae bacterium]